jgi:hypothetical protein
MTFIPHLIDGQETESASGARFQRNAGQLVAAVRQHADARTDFRHSGTVRTRS